MWTAVTSVYYDVPHFPEEANNLHNADQTHLFCCHYTFLPRIQNNLNLFPDGWDNHPLRIECPLTPMQLAALKDTVDPRSSSQSHGIDIYMAAVQFCQSLEL